MSGCYGKRKGGCGGRDGDSGRVRGNSTPNTGHTKDTVEDYLF